MKLIIAVIPILAAVAGYGSGRGLGADAIRSETSPDATLSAGEASSFQGGGSTAVAVSMGTGASGGASHARSETGSRVRVVREFLPLLSEEQLTRVVRSAAEWNVEGWNVVLDEVLESEDPELFALAQPVLVRISDPAAMERLAKVFAVESHPGRRGLFAYALGDLDRSVAISDQVSTILEGTDEVALERVLENLDLDYQPEECRPAMAMRLRRVALGAESLSTRSKAIDILSDDDSPEGIRFLLDRIIYEPFVELQKTALNSLRYGYSSDRIRDEVVTAVYSIMLSPNRDADLRRQAARHLKGMMDREKDLGFSDDEKAMILEMAKYDDE